VIVRLMGEGQYRIDADVAETLNELDNQAAQAVEAGDEGSLRRLLGEMASTVRDRGERLDDADLSPSEGIVPPEDLSLEEAKQLFDGEGLIPDLPAG
jgi:PspA-Associated protein